MCSCLACGSRQVEPFITVGKMPLLVFPADESVKNEIVCKKLVSIFCRECSHIFAQPLDSHDADLIYGKYYQFYPYEQLETMLPLYRLPFEKLFSFILSVRGLNTNKSRLLEIGCSSGEHLEFFNQYGLNSYGIDPSPLNLDKSGRLISGYFEQYEFEQPFEIIVSRFNLEHVNDISHYLRKSYQILNDNGMMFIQVPNVQMYASKMLPLFLAHEHVQYFNPYSLFISARKAGFAVTAADYKNGHSIIMVLMKKESDRENFPVEKLPSYFFEEYLKRRELLSNQVNSLLNEDKHVCFYGAGLTLNWILYELEQLHLKDAVIIDDNAIIHGKFMPLTPYRVYPFDIQIINSFSKLLLTLNPAYHDQVLKRLRKSGYNGEVYSLSQEGMKKSRFR